MTPTTLELRLAGEKVRILIEGDPALRRRIAGLFPSRILRIPAPCDVEILWTSGSGVVRRGGRTVGRARSAALLSLTAEWAATDEALRRLRRSALLLHASWVTSPRGGLLLVGAHGRGKTTLAAALALRHRWGLHADDLVVFDRRGTVRALERPVRLKPGSATALPELRRLGIDPAPWRAGWPILVPLGRFGRPRRRPLRAIILLEARGAGPARLARLEGGRAVATLARHVANFRERPAESLQLLARVARRVGVWRLSGGSLEDRCHALRGEAL